ncbi:carbohydrate sulfotransferase 4-like isoform X2 [Argopecten irradians]|uniref:carbohydrate sulfotransferase 4-like isoform X2 n=1 Tax=Argopecten irradians TaxID=31199 RepID=UPI0037152DF6
MRARHAYLFILITGILLVLLRYIEFHTKTIMPSPVKVTRFRSVSDSTSAPVPILIVSYMRSGSTFTSDVIASYPSSYYIFEPLIYVIPKIKHKYPIQLINGTTILPEADDEAAILSDILFYWLTCQYGGLDLEYVLTISTTHSTTRFKMCLETKQNNTEPALQTCLKILQKQCESSTIRVIKTIRVRMKRTVQSLLERIPGLKVIHLFRDQRPRLLSAERTPTMLFHSLQTTAKSECSNALDDIVIHQELERTYPGQLATILYERLAENPPVVFNHIFNFLQLPFTRKSLEYIQYITSSATEVQCNFCTKKKNSTKTAHAWRTKKSSDFEKIKMIQRECKETQNALGYLPLNSITEMRNTSVKLRMATPFTADAL